MYWYSQAGQVLRKTMRLWKTISPIYADFAQVLIAIARPLYVSESLGFDLDSAVYALDSTTIDRCLSLFPWAKFKTSKAAVKMHTLLDLRGSTPTY